MIVIDMDMPTKCMNCRLLGRDTMYCQVYPRRDLNLIKVANGKPDWCPIKCDIEVIKKEIKDARLNQLNDETEKAVNYGLNTALGIIDKHKAESEE